MKNKRTKLTAILLSALMAVSTISSVTFAADLFSDGSEQESTIETSGEEVSNDDLVADDDYLATVDSTASDYVKDDGFSYNENEVQREGNSIYYIMVIYGKDTSETRVEAEFVDHEPATCKHPERDRCTFTTNTGATRVAYYNYSTTNGDHRWIEKTLEGYDHTAGGYDPTDVPNNPVDCEEDGYRIIYNVCKDCGGVKYVKSISGTDVKFDADSTKTFSDIETRLFNSLSSLLQITQKDELKQALEDYLSKGGYDKIKATLDSANTVGNIWLDINVVSGLGHEYGEPYITVQPPEDHVDYDKEWDPNKNNGKHSSAECQDHWEKLANCKIDPVKHTLMGATDPTKDAYYYNVAKCKKCGKIVGDKRKEVKYVFYHAPNMNKGETTYVVGEGVRYFIDKKTKTKTATEILENELADYDVVLTDCELGGKYYKVTYNERGGIATKEEIVVPAGHHVWGKPTITIYDEDKNVVDKTKWSQYVVFETDENGDTVVKSINCTNKAYYEISQRCVNPDCNTLRPDIGGMRQALPGEHVWGERKLDPTKTKYTPVDEIHHLEEYIDRATCMLCGTVEYIPSATPKALVNHQLVPQEIDGTQKDPTCGVEGSVERADKCICGYVDESTRTTVTIPPTDEHDFGENKAILKWEGDAYIDGTDGFRSDHNIKIYVGRICNVCGEFEGNGINQHDLTYKGKLDPGYDITATDHFKNDVIVKDIVEAKKDPATGIAYRCSTGHVTLEVNWVGTVDGELVKLNSETTEEAIKEDIPYYSDLAEYQARTAHTPGKPQKEGDEIITRCTVCGDIVKRETDTTSSIGVPTVTAASVDFDTVNVSWTKVEGATAYRLYYRSSDEGISKWAKIRTFTGDTTSYAVNGLITGSKYRFTVRAEVTQDGKTTLGDYSKKGAVAVPKLTAPEIKSVTAAGKTTKVTWTRVDGASGYIVFRNSQRVGTVTKGSKVTWTDKKRVSGAKYQVRAYRTEAKKNFKSDLSEPK